METLGLVTWFIALTTLAFNAGMWVLALRRIRSWRTLFRGAADPDRWPAVHVFVCLKGHLPDIRETVLALDAQDYPGDYRVTFVTEGHPEEGDPAAGQLRDVLPFTRRCDHAVAGRVMDAGVRCAQKNFNLLAGIRHAEASRHGIQVYAFCDGDLHVQQRWLREIVRPIATGGTDATTSMHYATPAERRLLGALHTMAETSQSFASLVCHGTTWGGSMAIRSATFARMGLARIWGETCVDDISMSRALREARLRVTPVPEFLVSSRSAISSYWSFIRWLGRQFFFVKIYLPSRWHLLWAKFALDVSALWLAAFHLSHRLLRGEWAAGPAAGWSSLLVITAVLGAFLFHRHFLPERPPLRAWLGASLLVHTAALLACADATLRRKRLIWRDLTYVVARDGRVVTVTPNGAREEAIPPPAEEPVPEEALA